jgi:hypothetical protein
VGAYFDRLDLVVIEEGFAGNDADNSIERSTALMRTSSQQVD